MKLKVGDQVMVEGQTMYVCAVDQDKSVRVHPDKGYGGVGYGPFPKSVYREWPVL